MTSRDFVYWLQGFMELKEKAEPITERQVELIQKHLNLVFKHEIDPSMGDQAVQNALDKIHNAPSKYPPSKHDTLVRC